MTHFFRQLDHGQMTMTLREGEKLIFGNPEGIAAGGDERASGTVLSSASC